MFEMAWCELFSSIPVCSRVLLSLSSRLWSVGLVIERLRVRIPAGETGEFSCPELLLRADSFFRCPFHSRVTVVARKRPRSFCQKCVWQVTPKHAYTRDPTKSEWADYAAVQAWCRNLSRNELTRNSSGNTRLQSS